jgi:hypothetical protein
LNSLKFHRTTKEKKRIAMGNQSSSTSNVVVENDLPPKQEITDRELVDKVDLMATYSYCAPILHIDDQVRREGFHENLIIGQTTLTEAAYSGCVLAYLNRYVG